jgi:hypothetical protein
MRNWKHRSSRRKFNKDHMMLWKLRGLRRCEVLEMREAIRCAHRTMAPGTARDLWVGDIKWYYLKKCEPRVYGLDGEEIT